MIETTDRLVTAGDALSQMFHSGTIDSLYKLEPDFNGLQLKATIEKAINALDKTKVKFDFSFSLLPYPVDSEVRFMDLTLALEQLDLMNDEIESVKFDGSLNNILVKGFNIMSNKVDWILKIDHFKWVDYFHAGLTSESIQMELGKIEIDRAALEFSL